MSTILITGATSGIGKTTAQYLSEKGYNLVVVGRDAEKTKYLSEKIKNCVGYYILDLTDCLRIDECFSDIKKKGIKLNGLVHCAGFEGLHLPVRMIQMDAIDSLMALHFKSFVEMCKCFYQRQISEDCSSIIAVSSLAAELCNKNSLDYSASKAALNCAVKVMAKEFIKRKIRVNAILPGYVNTQMNDDLGEYIDINAIQPLGLIDSIQIAYLIELLLSEKARFITGACLPISGGFASV